MAGEFGKPNDRPLSKMGLIHDYSGKTELFSFGCVIGIVVFCCFMCLLCKYLIEYDARFGFLCRFGNCLFIPAISGDFGGNSLLF
jgi:hypothetical protein